MWVRGCVGGGCSRGSYRGKASIAYGSVSAVCLGCNFPACTPARESSRESAFHLALMSSTSGQGCWRRKWFQRTSTHSLNSPKRSPTEAWTGAANRNSTTISVRARNTGDKGLVLPVRILVMLSAFIERGTGTKRKGKMGWIQERGIAAKRHSGLKVRTTRKEKRCRAVVSGRLRAILRNKHHTVYDWPTQNPGAGPAPSQFSGGKMK